MNRLANRILGTVLVVAVAFLGAASSSRGTGLLFNVTDLGQVIATGMNDAGHVIYFSQITGHSYLWVNGSATDLGAFSALAINNSDVVVGAQGNPGNAVEWTSGGGLVTLPLLSGWDTANATGINASGAVTGFAAPSWAPGTSHAVVWNSPSADPTDLDASITDTCQSSEGHAINASGTVAAEGGYSPVSNCSLGTARAAFTLNGGATQLTPSGKSPSKANAVNDSGVVVGSIRVSGVDHPFMYDGTLHDLTGVTGIGVNGIAYAINSAGDIVGFSANLPASGWLDQNGTVTNLLNVTGIQLIPAGINSSDQIVARSVVTQHSYLLTPVSTDADLAASLSHTPEPATMSVSTDKAHAVWTARLANNGPAGATGAQLSVALPSGFSLSSGGLDSHCTGSGPFTCAPSGGTLASGSHIDFTIAADAAAPLSANATATASATSNDPSSSNDTATDAATVHAPVPTFTPTSGRVGAAVTITGAAFTGATSVDFHGTHSSFTVASDTEIDATVPAGATSGAVAVATPAGTWTSTQSFTVIPPAPTISGFSPARARVGASVTVTGTDLTGATTVQVGSVNAPFTVVSPVQLTFTVQVGTTGGQISVTTPGGTAKSRRVLQVPSVPPVVQGIAPLQGAVGTTVSIGGHDFTGATRVAFHGTAASYTVVSDSLITAQVPVGATTGAVSVNTPAGTSRSWQAFIVIPALAPAPTIVDFTPSAGHPGMRVVIYGDHFLGATSITFNGVPAAFRVLKGTEIVAVVPLGATTGHIAVTTPGGTATSSQVFTI